MIFLKPQILWALFAVAIPILIHLFNFRRYRKVYFTNVQMLKEVKLQSKKQSQLRHLLVLFTRILVIVALVIAFARPMIPAKEQSHIQDKQLVSLFIDNSFSMESEGESSSLIEEARQKARIVVESYQATDQFLLLTNELKVEHNRLYNQSDILELIDEVEISSSSHKISEIISFQKSFFEQNSTSLKNTYIISDFQVSQFDFGNLEIDSLNKIQLLPVQTSSMDNIYIDSVWFEEPILRSQEIVHLNVRLQNTSSSDIEKLALNLYINNQRKGLTQTEISSGKSKNITIPFQIDSTGIHYAQVKIDDYPVTYDDSYFFAFRIAKKTTILDIQGDNPSPYIHDFYGNDSSFVYHNQKARSLDYTSFAEHDLLVINGIEELGSGLASSLISYVSDGGNILFLPSEKGELESYNRFFNEVGLSRYRGIDTTLLPIQKIDFDNDIYKLAFEKEDIKKDNFNYPKARNVWLLSSQNQSLSTPILKLSNDNYFLEIITKEKGKVYRMNCNLLAGNGNLHQHALIVPTLYNLATLQNNEHPLQYTIDNNQLLKTSYPPLGPDDIYSIKKQNKESEFIPGFQTRNKRLLLNIKDQLHESGIYMLNKNKQLIDYLAFNYQRTESDLNYFTKSQLESISLETGLNFRIIDQSKDLLMQELEQIKEGKPLWKLFIILSLVFILIEVFLLRYLKSSIAKS